jgi:hypothetical protein
MCHSFFAIICRMDTAFQKKSSAKHEYDLSNYIDHRQLFFSGPRLTSVAASQDG